MRSCTNFLGMDIELAKKNLLGVVSSTPGATVDEVLAWRAELRKATDDMMIGLLKPVFNEELKSRISDEDKPIRETGRWANSVLFDADLSASPSKSGPACYLSVAVSRPGDRGRFYFRTLHSENAKQPQVGRFTPEEGLELCARPRTSFGRSLSR